MKRTSFTYGSDVFGKSHFLKTTPMFLAEATVSFATYLNGLKRQAWARAGTPNK